MNPLWKDLTFKIIDLLKQQRILYSHDPRHLHLDGQLSKPTDLRTLPQNCLLNGEPLFADRPGANRKYLSLQYQQDDVDVLKRAFLIPDIEDIHMFHRIKQDLESPSSIMRDVATDVAWHSLVADLIISILERSPGVGRMIEDQLALIPLSDGRWVKASTEDIHFPSLNGPPMPADLVTTIHYEAARNTSRKDLFGRLGVTNFSPGRVIDRIWSCYIHHNGASDLEASKAHFKYMYWHYPNIDDARFSRLWLFDTRLNKVTFQDSLMYMPSNDEYGPQELLKAAPDLRNPGQLAPECPVTYVHQEYIDLFPPPVRQHDLPWLTWLETLGVRRIPRLKDDAGSLSPEFRHILQYRPANIVKLLEMQWVIYRREIDHPIEGEISNAEVTCRDASLVVLSNTYFPLQNLTQEAEELGISSNFPFLAVPGLSEDERLLEDWRFLARFGVKFEANLNFYIRVLQQHRAQMHQPWNRDTRNGILKTYELIADHYNEINRAFVV